jgi:hypothetical protein
VVRSRECACGCGGEVVGRRSKRFVDDSHRQRAGRQRRRWFRRNHGDRPDPEVVAPESEPEVAPEPAWMDEDASGWHSWDGR